MTGRLFAFACSCILLAVAGIVYSTWAVLDAWRRP